MVDLKPYLAGEVFGELLDKEKFRNMNKLLYVLFITACYSCTNNAGTEKYQSERDNIVNVHDKLNEIKIDDVQINGYSSLYLMDNYLIVGDHKSVDKIIYIFDKNNFDYITSTGYLGQGPGEIATLGHIGVNETDRIFYVTDPGKLKIFSYNLDSVLRDPLYMPEVKMNINEKLIPNKYQYINDTLCLGVIIEPIGNADFKPSVGKWNMATGKIELMTYEHPEIEKKRIDFSASLENSIYVESYIYHDLLTICSLNGDLKYNIYGPNWDNKKSNRIHHFGEVVFCNDKIIAAYSGGANSTDEYFPTKFIVFDLTGNYIKTLNVGRMIYHFCFDKENNRIIMNLNDEMEFAYLDLDSL